MGMPATAELANRGSSRPPSGMITRAPGGDLPEVQPLRAGHRRAAPRSRSPTRSASARWRPSRCGGRMPTAEVTPLDVLLGLSRPEREGLGLRRAGPRRGIRRQGRRAHRARRSRPSTGSRRTACRTRTARPRVQGPAEGPVRDGRRRRAGPGRRDPPKLTDDGAARHLQGPQLRVPRRTPAELPTSLFAGAPDLTPHDAFPEVRDRVASTLAEERAREEINGKIDEIKNNTMRAFEDKYYDAGHRRGRRRRRRPSKPGPATS